MLNPADKAPPYGMDTPDIYDDATEEYGRQINVIGWLAFGFVLGLLVASFALWFPAASGNPAPANAHSVTEADARGVSR